MTDSQWWILFAVYFGLTLLLEAPFYARGFSDRSPKQKWVVWFCANAVSYPPVFFYFPYLTWSALNRELAAELWAPVCEIAVAFFLLSKVSRKEMLAIVLANLFSWQVGKMIVNKLPLLNWIHV